MRLKCLVAAFAAIASSTSCGRPFCGGTGLGRVTPAESTIAIGQQVTAQYQEGDSCLPTDAQYHNVATRWTTVDTLIVRLDSLTGVVVGLRAGDARVYGRTAAGPLPIVVHVR